MQELKIAKTIHAILSKAFQKDVLPEFWLVTIVEVKVSKDFSYADVFISNIPKNVNVIDFLKSKIWNYQRLINGNLQRKVVPKIRFHYDSTWEFVSSIDTIN